MSGRDDRISLVDMLNHGFTRRGQLERLGRRPGRGTRFAEIGGGVGEAANRVSAETQQCHQEIPWPQIIGMRNRLVHGYDDISLKRLWDAINDDLPPLIVGEEPSDVGDQL